jgi:hypothetical protein
VRHRSGIIDTDLFAECLRVHTAKFFVPLICDFVAAGCHGKDDTRSISQSQAGNFAKSASTVAHQSGADPSDDRGHRYHETADQTTNFLDAAGSRNDRFYLDAVPQSDAQTF